MRGRAPERAVDVEGHLLRRCVVDTGQQGPGPSACGGGALSDVLPRRRRRVSLGHHEGPPARVGAVLQMKRAAVHPARAQCGAVRAVGVLQADPYRGGEALVGVDRRRGGGHGSVVGQPQRLAGPSCRVGRSSSRRDAVRCTGSVVRRGAARVEVVERPRRQWPVRARLVGAVAGRGPVVSDDGGARCARTLIQAVGVLCYLSRHGLSVIVEGRRRGEARDRWKPGAERRPCSRRHQQQHRQ